MSEDLKALVEKKEPEFQGLFGRMDASKGLYLLDSYEMKDFDGNPIPKVVSTTVNDPGVFAYRSIAILSSSDPQKIVESDLLKKTDESPVEDFLTALDIEADDLLSTRIKGLSFPFYCEQACIRGWLVGMNLLRLDKKSGNLIPDRRPLDSRCVTYEPGIDGLHWGCYKTNRSRKKIMDEYGHDIGEGEQSAEVLDIYSRTNNQVWIGETKIKDKPHPYKKPNGEGYVPMVIQPIPTGSMLQDGDMLPHQGEDIFALDRGLYPKMNEMASVLENLTMSSFFAAMQYESEAGEESDQSEALPFGLGVVVSVEKGGGYKLIPVADIRNATRLLYSMLENRLQRGSLPNLDYGNLSFPLSAVAISKLTESKDMIFVPRLQGMAMFYQQMDRMAIDQYIQINKGLRLGEAGHRKVFPVASLKGEYTIKRQYFQKSPEQDLANISTANQIRPGLISDYTTRRDILKMRNPDKEEDLIRAEQAEKLNPVITLRRQVHSLIDREEFLEAELTLQAAEDLLRQRATGQVLAEQPKPEGEVPVKSAIPLLEGGGASRGKTEEEKMGEASGEEEEETLGRRAETARVGRPTEE